jgi:hypothetical protein
MNREQILRRRIRWLTLFFIFGLFLFGASNSPCVFTQWLLRIRNALDDTQSRQPFLFYGTDWLAFGHFIIALVFIGAWRDPVRNRWLFDFGLIASVLVIPFALVFGGWRGIPLWWRLIDCSFGVFGFIPLWFCRSWTLELEKSNSP